MYQRRVWRLWNAPLRVFLSHLQGTLAKIAAISSFLYFLYDTISEGTNKIAPRSSGKKFGFEVILAVEGQDIAMSHSLQGYPVPLTR